MINILVAVDFCDHSPLTLEVAFALARGARGRVTAIHVVQIPEGPGDEGEGWENLERYARTSANDLLDRLLRRTGLDDRVDRILRVGGSPSKVIGEEARALGADLIVVGTHERGALSRLVMGSVGRRVQRQASCPVVTVRSGIAEALARGARTVGPRRAALHGGCLE
jgi:nucleotide-binding universal stress UspA family protein